MFWTPAIMLPEQHCWEVCCSECQAPSLPYPQQEIQIEAFKFCLVVFRALQRISSILGVPKI